MRHFRFQGGQPPGSCGLGPIGSVLGATRAVGGPLLPAPTELHTRSPPAEKGRGRVCADHLPPPSAITALQVKLYLRYYLLFKA